MDEGKFLSTLPARGATGGVEHRLGLLAISIHAPREESDSGRQAGKHRPQHFYPRSPRGERQRCGQSGHQLHHNFYPRSPRGERPVWLICLLLASETYFYPRSPRGERRCTPSAEAGCQEFLSTLPARGATKSAMRKRKFFKISIHAPREGSDHAIYQNSRNYVQYFYPRSPRGERPLARTSTTAPPTYFYPRSPRGERRDRGCSQRVAVLISIHAPREGSDVRVMANVTVYNLFLSTLPARGATGKCVQRR